MAKKLRIFIVLTIYIAVLVLDSTGNSLIGSYRTVGSEPSELIRIYNCDFTVKFTAEISLSKFYFNTVTVLIQICNMFFEKKEKRAHWHLNK